MFTPIPFNQAIAPARARYEFLIEEAVRWCAEHGREVDPDLFALICAGAGPFGGDNDVEHALRWTRVGVRVLLRCGIPNWCAFNNSTTWPLEVVPAVWHWLDFLHDTGRMNPASDPIWELRKPLICYGGLDFDGRWRPEDDPSPIPCECYLPYRESVEYLNGRLTAGSLTEDILFRDDAGRNAAAVDLAVLGKREGSDRSPRSPGRRRRAAARPPNRAAKRWKRAEDQ